MNGISITSEQFGQLLWAASWQAAVLAVFVAVVSRLLHRQIRPAWQFALWSLVFVRLACPVLPSSVFSVQNVWVQLEPPATAATAKPPVRSSITMPEEQGRGSDFQEAEFAVEDSRIPPAQEPPLPVPGPSDADSTDVASIEFSFWPTMMVLWGTIALLLLIRQFLLWWRLMHMSSQWKNVADAQTLEVLEDCRRSVGLRRSVRFLQADGQVGPAVLGIWNPCVVLPADVLATVSTQELRMLLLHELQHVRRWDVLWDRLATLLVIGHWFNPVVWWARKCLRDAREQACDAAVLKHLGAEDAKSYGHLVMSLAERQQHRTTDAVLVGMLGRSLSLSRRIESIAEYRPSSLRHTSIGLALMVALIVGGLTNAQKPNAEKEIKTDVAGTAASRDENENQGYSLVGECRDGDKQPLKDVRLRLFRVNEKNKTRELVKEIKTKADGRFRFEDLPAPVPVQAERGVNDDYVFYETYYLLAATKPGYSSYVIDRRYEKREKANEDITMVMKPAGKLTGRVTDPEGNPIAGATVFLRAFPYSSMKPIENVQSAVTDQQGRYEIDDLVLWDASKIEPRKVGENLFEVPGGCYFSVYHPDYGVERPLYEKIPSAVDVTLQPAAIIEGKVVDRVTGKPADNARVFIQGVHPTNGSREVRTNHDGIYRIPAVNAGTYNIMCYAPERTCVAHDSVVLEAGKTYSGLDLELMEGSWIEGRLVDAKTGKPYSQGEGRRLRVATYGPANPKSGAAVRSSAVDDNGRFALRVPPGVNYPYIMMPDVWKRAQDKEKYEEGIQVGEGELVVLEFRVLPEPPRKKPKFSPVRLPISVPEEREAAAGIRRLGGWYQVDDEKHVVEVNMVYHETAEGVRHDNKQTKSNEALSWVEQFPKLKRLFLKGGQVDDESLKHVKNLTELEVFCVWNGRNLSDAGMQHLAGLTTLKEIAVSSSHLTDKSLKIFSELPQLQSLSLQNNEFTDLGVSYLKNSLKLKTLWIGSERSKLTDRACFELANHTNLESLGLGHALITDRGIKQLENLKQLKMLNVGGTDDDAEEGITDKSVEVISGFENLEFLFVNNCRFTERGVRRIAEMKHLKKLSLAGTPIPREIQEEFNRKHPDGWFYWSSSNNQ